MAIALKEIVPWGRSLAEYEAMFALSDRDRFCSILDCGGGPASFNAELTRAGGKVISCDPIYQFSAAEIASRIEEVAPIIVAGTRENYDQFVWQNLRSPEHLGEVRLESMRRFLEDFEPGKQQGRYRVEALPNLSFSTGEFDLALCSHLLFTYSEELSLEFHLAALEELGRVAQEVRVFPILTKFSTEVSPHLKEAIAHCQEQGYRVSLESVAYEFQKGGNRCLRLFPPG